MDAGRRLRATRERLGLTVRQVEALSLRLAAKHDNTAFGIPLSRLSEIETRGVVPSIYRLYSFSVIYRRDLRELLSWYGMDVAGIADDSNLVEAPRTHLAEALDYTVMLKVPRTVDPGFNPAVTTNLGPMIQQWGMAPLASLGQFSTRKYSYGYIGSEDYTMYPLLPPGSFVQIDESQDKVMEEPWRSEHERPIYFIETRDGYRCCWCSLKDGHLTLQPHPLSPEPVMIFRSPQEAEVLGQVVGVAMRLDTRRGPR